MFHTNFVVLVRMNECVGHMLPGKLGNSHFVNGGNSEVQHTSLLSGIIVGCDKFRKTDSKGQDVNYCFETF